MRDDLAMMLREQLEYRELLLSITRRDLILRYKHSVMGFGWAVFMPLLHMLIFSIIFTRVAPLDTGVPYPIYAYAGLLPWSWFATSLRFSATSLTDNSNLVTKVYFPREIFPFSAVVVGFIDFLVAATLLAALMLYYGIGITWTVLFLPVVILVQFAFTAGIALLVAMANLFFRDVKYVFEVLLTVWMFATSVVYPVERIGGRLGTLLAFNPMTPIIDGYRAVLLRGELPPALPFAAASLLSLAILAVCWLSFHRAEFRFAEDV
ncbi:ABC transporter permease [soil metagenome]